jgi:hypothetical protein
MTMSNKSHIAYKLSRPTYGPMKKPRRNKSSARLKSAAQKKVNKHKR